MKNIATGCNAIALNIRKIWSIIIAYVDCLWLSSFTI